MRIGLMVLAALPLLVVGCSTKEVRIGGMMCPQGHSQEQVNQDLRECRFYGPQEHEAALKASLPKTVEPECIKCLEEKGYKITE